MYVKFMLSPSESEAITEQVMSEPCGAGDGETETETDGGLFIIATEVEKFSDEYFESQPVSGLLCEQFIMSVLFAPAAERPIV